VSKNSLSLSVLPEPAQATLVRLGARLRAHRVQRGWTVADMAERMLCAPTTWRAVESGKAGSSVGLWVHALWLFGELDALDAVAPAPAALAANKRVRRARQQPGVVGEDERDF